MTIDFYVNENKLDECKAFIRTLPTARFNGNPIKIGNKYNINLTISVDDCNKLNQISDKWYEEDLPPKHSNIWKRIKDFIGIYLKFIIK